ncbi:MAG TPA: hypothetical protein VFA20_14375 [Myxococcaceae bacterium]|nr:hypothetical protein [Myxococcaceae bacterium]
MAEFDPADGFQRACMAALAVVGVPTLSGAFRAVLGVSLGAGLAMSAAAVGAAVALWARRAPRRAAADGRTWLGVGLAGVGTIATLAVLWNGRFDGLVTVGGGDAGAHAAWALSFARSNPGEYFGFVGTYALWHWMGAAFGFDAFERERAGFYLTAAAVMVAVGHGVRVAVARGVPLRAAVAWSALGLAAASRFGFWPVLHYHQADGFYGHLFALVPLLAAWLAYGQLEDARARAAALVAAVGVMRFTYGLNLGDLALTSAALVAWEALRLERMDPRAGAPAEEPRIGATFDRAGEPVEEPRIGAVPGRVGARAPEHIGSSATRLRPALLLLAAALTVGAVVAYAQLLPLADVEGGFIPTRLGWLLPGLAILTAGLFAAARLLPPRARRLAAFAGAFGAVNLAAHLAYLGAGLQPRYYLYKYSLHAVILLLGAWVAVGAAISGWRALAAGVVGLVMVARGSPYERSFEDRLRRSPPWTLVGPLTDRDADARITATLSEKRADFGGLLTASWPMASFMNGERGRYLDVPAFQRAELDDSPGHCVFWFEQESPLVEAFDAGGSRDARAAAIDRLHSDPAARCESYAPRWDPSGAQVLCHRCR